MKTPDANQKLHHHLITGKIVFSEPNSDVINVIELNAVVAHTDKNIPVALIGRAQQTLQLQFFNRMENPELEVRDVVISNFCYLGELTQAEFQAPPVGNIQQERDVLDAVFAGATNDHVH
jgi:hypothetical protein